jgi:hypothetical protein
MRQGIQDFSVYAENPAICASSVIVILSTSFKQQFTLIHAHAPRQAGYPATAIRDCFIQKGSTVLICAGLFRIQFFTVDEAAYTAATSGFAVRFVKSRCFH